MMDGVKKGSVRSSMYQDVQFSGVSKDQLIQVSLVNLGQGENLADPKQQSQYIDRKLIQMAKRSPRSSSTKIKAQLPQSAAVSTRTIRRRLLDAGLKSCRPAKKPLLSSKNIKDRIAFCEKYHNWTEDQWENVLFSLSLNFIHFQDMLEDL